MKVLNLYACLGGNRLLWDDCHVTAVENDPELAKIYKERFPDDSILVEDAHEYLLKNYQEFDFIWSSPPCPSHSRARFWGHGSNGRNPVYPDLKLYEEILFLEHHHKGFWVVENVIPYYAPLIEAKKRGRHLYWTNFEIPEVLSNRREIVGQGVGEAQTLAEFHKVDISAYQGDQRKLKLLRNMVCFEAGKAIFDAMKKVNECPDGSEQKTFFEEFNF